MLCAEVMIQQQYGSEPKWLQRENVQLQNNIILHLVQEALMCLYTDVRETFFSDFFI